MSLIVATFSACGGDPGGSVAESTTGGVTSGEESTGTTDRAVEPSSGGDATNCGNGNLEPGEVCDDGTANGLYGQCNATCSGFSGFCGDEIVQPQERCDDANDIDGDGCNTNCESSGSVLWSLKSPNPEDIHHVLVAPDGRTVIQGGKGSLQYGVAQSLWLAAGDPETGVPWEHHHFEIDVINPSFIPEGDGWLFLGTAVGLEFPDLVLTRFNGEFRRVDSATILEEVQRIDAGPDGEIIVTSLASDVPVVSGYGAETFALDDFGDPLWSHTIQDKLSTNILISNESAFYYVSDGFVSGSDLLTRQPFTANASGSWWTSDSLIAFDTAQLGIHRASEAGIFMSGSASSSTHEPEIRLYDAASGELVMSKALEVDALHGCSASATDLFCIVEDDGMQLNKYDASGGLVWEAALDFGEGDYFVKANPDGTSYVWRNTDGGSEVWKLSK